MLFSASVAAATRGSARGGVPGEGPREPVLFDDVHEALDRLAQEADAVADELDRRVDLVRDSGREGADRDQLFRLEDLSLQPPVLGHVPCHQHRRLAPFEDDQPRRGFHDDRSVMEPPPLFAPVCVCVHICTGR